VDHDAIGQDILGMYRFLSRANDCYLYGHYLCGVDCCRALPREALQDFLDDPANTVIYHHSNYWPEAGEWLSGARARFVFKYHNLTPPEFFEGYADYADKCLLGREQTKSLMAAHPQALWLGDSRFNLSDAGIGAGMASFVVPPFVPLAEPQGVQPDAALLKSLIDDPRIHVLFTGRFVPNKGHRMLLSVLKEFVRRHGDGIVANVIGKLDPVCQPYHDDVLRRAADWGLDAHLQYVGELTDSQLLSYYLGSDVYLCCSDHEGFCVPIAESQCAHLPVIAKARAAVPETLGDGGVLLEEDPAPYADAIHRIHTERPCRQDLVARGYANFVRRFSYTAVETRFRFALERWMGAAL
jgi:glycosyltransferase involved in cell wall biosynthesis